MFCIHSLGWTDLSVQGIRKMLPKSLVWIYDDVRLYTTAATLVIQLANTLRSFYTLDQHFLLKNNLTDINLCNRFEPPTLQYFSNTARPSSSLHNAHSLNKNLLIHKKSSTYYHVRLFLFHISVWAGKGGWLNLLSRKKNTFVQNLILWAVSGVSSKLIFCLSLGHFVAFGLFVHFQLHFFCYLWRYSFPIERFLERP